MELYMVCVLMAIALSMFIIKGLQLVLSIIHPLPSEADIRWRQNPRLPLEQHKKIVTTKTKPEKNKPKEPKSKRLPRNIRLERLHSGSPLSFDEFDTSFSRRSDMDSYTRSPARCIDDYVMRPQNPANIMLLEQMSYAEEEDEDDPIEAYVVQQHRKIIESSQNRSSTPIQSPETRSPTSPQYLKSHDTIV